MKIERKLFTFILANGIDREKYLQSKMKSDFVIGNSNYFNVNKHFRTNDDALDEAVINEINRQEGFLQGGAMYSCTPMGESLFEYPDWEQTRYGNSHAQREKRFCSRGAFGDCIP